MSVNDLAEEIRTMSVKNANGGILPPESIPLLASLKVSGLTDTAWHPLSEPPTEEDADPDGEVLLWMGEGVVDLVSYRALQENWQEPWYEETDRWARIRDVVLFPIGDK